MKLVYLGTPQLAVPPLQALHDAGHEILRVVSGPDRRRGRGGARSPSPVKAAALALGVDVVEDPAEVVGIGAELGVVVAFGRIIGPAVLAEVPMVNLHVSLLPRWRGAAPVERAILAGDAETGVCVMDVAEGLDTGGVHRRASVPLDDDVTAEALGGELVRIGTELLLELLDSGLGVPEPQAVEGVTYAAKLTAADRRLDLAGPARQAHRVVRIGGAWTTFRGRRLKVLAAAVDDDPQRRPPAGCAPGTIVDGTRVAFVDGWLELLEVQPEGRAPLPADAWANGARPDGEQLGT